MKQLDARRGYHFRGARHFKHGVCCGNGHAVQAVITGLHQQQFDVGISGFRPNGPNM
jgi:hypothetical protein